MRVPFAVGAALVAALVPAAEAAPTESPGVLRARVAEAIADEERAWELLMKDPPRWETARGAVVNSIETLRELRGQLPAQPPGIRGDVDRALSADIRALAWISQRDTRARSELDTGLTFKRRIHGYWLATRRAGPQCADGRDNDGDKLVDARYDGGCASSRDGSETSPLTCRLAATTTGLTGACSGPFAGLEVAGSFETSATPAVDFAVGCGYSSATKLECHMQDGVSNPRHVVKARFKLATLSVSGLRVLVKDFAGRARAQTVAVSGGGSTTVDPVSARCAGRFDFATATATVRCDGADVKSSSVAGPPVLSVRPADAASSALSGGCEVVPVSGGTSAGRCYWKPGNRGKALAYQFTTDRQLGSVTIHVLAGGTGKEGTTIVLRQVWTRLADGTILCRQSTPSAGGCATP